MCDYVFEIGVVDKKYNRPDVFVSFIRKLTFYFQKKFIEMDDLERNIAKSSQ